MTKMLDFKKFVAENTRLDPSCWKGYKKDGTKVVKGTTVNNCVPEEAEPTDEALSIKQRRDRGIALKRNKAKLAMGRRRASRKIASNDKLIKRAQRQARNQVAQKITKGIPKGELTPSRKAEIEKRLDKMKPRIDRLAKRMVKDVRKAEIAKKRGK